MRPKQIGQGILDVLFPRRCGWCGKVVGFAKTCGCKSWQAVNPLPCQPLQLCPEGPFWLQGAWAYAAYEGPVRQMLLRFKFKGEQELAPLLGEMLWRCFSACGLEGGYDLLIPTPVSRRTYKKRGYNQSALLARELARYTGLACDEETLWKTGETEQQMRLDRAQRLKNVKGAFAADGNRVLGRRVLIVDDIATTGSTLNACGEALVQAGATACSGLCVAAALLPGEGRMDAEDAGEL